MPNSKQDTYQGLAGIYDYVMRHVDYDNWAAYIHEVMVRFEHRPRSLVDLACGSGNISMELCALGCPVTAGVDGSEAMLRIAREKAVLADRDIDFVQRDLLQLADLGPFDAAVCIYDSINYLLSLDDVGIALGEIYSMLNPNGLFIFDVCTEQNSLRYFSDVEDREQGPGFFCERHSYYNEGERLQMNHFSIRFEGQDRPFEELHVQRIYPVDEIVAAVEASSFELLGAFDGFTFKRGSERSDRIHFALRHPPA